MSHLGHTYNVKVFSQKVKFKYAKAKTTGIMKDNQIYARKIS